MEVIKLNDDGKYMEYMLLSSCPFVLSLLSIAISHGCNGEIYIGGKTFT